MPDVMRSKWTIPVFCWAVGLVLLGAGVAGHQARVGVAMLTTMVAFGLLVLAGGRSETVKGLRGDGRDERFEMLDLRATAAAGLVLIVAVIGGFVWEIAHGRSGAPYMWLGAVAGLAYIAAVVYLRLRG